MLYENMKPIEHVLVHHFTMTIEITPLKTFF